MDYISERLEPQMKYYSKRSKSLRKEYLTLSIIIVIVNATIPVISIGLDSVGPLKYIVALLSSMASILSSVLLIRKTKDTWIEFRMTYEKLKKEKVLFETHTGKYKDAQYDDFVLSCEEIMESEHKLWRELHKDATQK